MDHSDAHLIHNTIADNQGRGQGVWLSASSRAWLTNTILAGNQVGIEASTGNTATLSNTLWWGNSQNTVGPGPISTSANVMGGPAFVNPQANDYHILSTSAAVDRGIDVGAATDIDGETRPMAGGYDLGADELTWPAPVVPVPGGAVSPSPSVTMTFPAGAFTDTVLIHYTVEPPSDTGTLQDVGVFFDLGATYQSSGLPAVLGPGETYTIVVGYREEDVPAGFNEAGLALYFWSGSAWEKEPTSVVNTVANTITATPGHFSLWAALGSGQHRIFLPAVFRAN